MPIRLTRLKFYHLWRGFAKCQAKLFAAPIFGAKNTDYIILSFGVMTSELSRDMLVGRRRRSCRRCAHVFHRHHGWVCVGGHVVGVVDEDGEDGEDERDEDEDEDLHGGDLRVQVLHGGGE